MTVTAPALYKAMLMRNVFDEQHRTGATDSHDFPCRNVVKCDAKHPEEKSDNRNEQGVWAVENTQPGYTLLRFLFSIHSDVKQAHHTFTVVPVMSAEYYYSPDTYGVEKK